MSVKLRKQKSGKTTQSLYLDINFKGQRSRKALNMFLYVRPKDILQKLHNEETTKQAEVIRANRQLELQGALNGVEYIPTNHTTFHQFFKDFTLKYPHKDGRKYEGALIHFEKYYGTKPFHLSQEFLDGFKKYLSTGAGLKGETPHTYKGRFKKICTLAYNKRIIKTDPAKLDWVLKFDRNAFRKEVLNESELQQLASTACGNNDVKRLFLFCCNTGLRFGDAKKLTWGDIKDYKIGIVQGKTGRTVYVDLNHTARTIAGPAGKPNQLLFPDLPTTTNGAQGTLKTWYTAAKIEKHITTHCARHTFCTLLMKNKVDPKTITTLMGWSESEGVKQLMRYSHFLNESGRAAVNSLPQFELTN
jgi:integrase